MWADSSFSRQTRTSVSKIARPSGAWVNAQFTSVSSAWSSRWWLRRSSTVTAVTNHWATVPLPASSGWACSHTSRPCPSRWRRATVPLQLRPSVRWHRAGCGSGAARRSAAGRPTISAGGYPSGWWAYEPHAVTTPCGSTLTVTVRFMGRSSKRSPGVMPCAPSPSISPPSSPRDRGRTGTATPYPNQPASSLPRPCCPGPPVRRPAEIPRVRPVACHGLCPAVFPVGISRIPTVSLAGIRWIPTVSLAGI